MGKCYPITNTKMDTLKAEFRRLIDLMGWSQTETARRLHKTPSAINHLVNPDHPNQPTLTMMQLLKLIIASERPDLINPQTFELTEAPPGAKLAYHHLTPRDQAVLAGLKKLPADEQEKVYAIIEALLRTIGRKGGKRKK